jgi:hypothetical protein
MGNLKKIRWLGKEFGGYIEGKVLTLDRIKNIPNCYGNDKGNFYIHEISLAEFPDSWEEVLDDTQEVVEEKEEK